MDGFRESRGAGWTRAREILEGLFRSLAPRGARVEVGYVKRVGDGVSREVYGAPVGISPDPDRWSDAYAILLPRSDSDESPDEIDRRTRWEAELLSRLPSFRLPFRTCRAAGVVPESGRSVLVRTFLNGIPLDLRSGQQGQVEPWVEVARVAAAIHAVPGERLGGGTPGHPTLRAHALDELKALDGLPGPDFDEARSWAAAHLPPEAPSSLVHGDLLGQNIILGVGEPNGVIDWEYSRRGDHAFDLAIVTRCKGSPFKLADGMTRLLRAYRDAGGAEVTEAHVRLYELCLAANWHRGALRGDRYADPPEQSLGRFRNVLKRAREAGE